MLRTDLEALYRKRDEMEALARAEKKLEEQKKERAECIRQVESSIAERPATYEAIRKAFSDIMNFVLDRDALLSSRVNKYGNIDFSAEFVSVAGDSTSEDEGSTYRKMLCVAFDFSILKAYVGTSFPHFAFHDGVFEALDNRKKRKLIQIIRVLSEQGIQQIITAIDSDIPEDEMESLKTEVVCLLHDGGISGLLFKMEPW